MRDNWEGGGYATQKGQNKAVNPHVHIQYLSCDCVIDTFFMTGSFIEVVCGRYITVHSRSFLFTVLRWPCPGISPRPQSRPIAVVILTSTRTVHPFEGLLTCTNSTCSVIGSRSKYTVVMFSYFLDLGRLEITRTDDS